MSGALNNNGSTSPRLSHLGRMLWPGWRYAEADQINGWEDELVAIQRQINRLLGRQAELISRLDPHQI
ncbi:MAG TPA: hypothetical protein VHL55_00720, partial [Acidimicrobiia bacterium]|nr:hypothetical protein [Acidimicrobiia bacterium]